MNNNLKYPHLFSPLKINSIMVSNRIIANPMGQVFEERALGRPGVMIAGSVITQPGKSSWASAEEPYAFSKYQVEKTRRRVLLAHRGGAKASVEIAHAGQYARVAPGDFAIGPTGYVREDGVEVKAMYEAMMDELAAGYVQTAIDARDVGFDMIFLHFGHGWLIPEFLSPLFNKRTDEYGGSIENRMKFPLRVLREVREAVGPYFPIEMRISANEYMPGGISFEDVLAFVKAAQKYIDVVQVSCGLDIEHEANVYTASTNFTEHGLNVKYAKVIKENVDILVSVVGAIMNPDEAEEILASGAADMVALARPMVADPDWPIKALEGRPEDIVPCLRCLQCYHIATNRRNVGCSVNPRYTNEDWVPKKLPKAEKKKRIVIVGAGPAGCRAALTAKERGHEVILIEKRDHIGGAIHYVAMEHFKVEVKAYLEYLKTQIGKTDIDLRLNTEASPEMVRTLQPDALIIAVGALPAKPPIPGIDCTNVMGFYEAIEHEERIGQNVVIIGGGTIGAEIGLELSLLKKKNVTIVEMINELAVQGNMLYKIGLRHKMNEAETLQVMLEAGCQEITETNVRVKDKDERERVLPADAVIIATGVRADRKTAESFYGITPETYMIGDCEKPRKIQEATMEGYTVAATL